MCLHWELTTLTFLVAKRKGEYLNLCEFARDILFLSQISCIKMYFVWDCSRTVVNVCFWPSQIYWICVCFYQLQVICIFQNCKLEMFPFWFCFFLFFLKDIFSVFQVHLSSSILVWVFRKNMQGQSQWKMKDKNKVPFFSSLGRVMWIQGCTKTVPLGLPGTAVTEVEGAIATCCSCSAIMVSLRSELQFISMCQFYSLTVSLVSNAVSFDLSGGSSLDIKGT